VTATAGIESQPAWAPDSRRLAYAARRDRGQQIYVYDFVERAERALTAGAAVDLSPVFSPDGASLAYLRDRRELRVLEIASGTDRVLSTGTFADTIDDPRPVWSPDGRWIALFAVGTRGFTNVELVPLDGGVRRPVSFLANTYANRIAWSPDGTFLLFDTRLRTEPGELARVDLTLRTPKFREDLFRDLFNTPARPPDPVTRPAEPAVRTAEPEPRKAGAPAPSDPVFAGIRDRLSIIPAGLDVSDVVISPDAKTAVLVANAAGQTNLYAYSLDELQTTRPVARQLTTSTGAKRDVQVTTDSKEVYFLDGGRVQVASIERREARPIAVTAEMTVDFAEDRVAVFDQAWTLLRDNFFDAGMNGVDWEASRGVYAARAAAAATPDELRRAVSLMIGDLNASHLGISGRGAGGGSVGRLGLEFDRREYESSGRLRVTTVVPLGPAALTREVAIGEYLVSVNGRATGPGVSLDELLENTVDRRVEVAVAATPAAAARTLVVRPASQATVKGLLYRAWVDANRDYVLKASGGRLGYVHMINMSAGALDQLHVDLDTENHARDGLVIDIRNNSGGFVNGHALDVFARQSYLRMATRSLPEVPARSVLGQRALELRTVLVTNQHSLSDAEDFTEGYRALKLGSIVGEPTAGWIIYTWNTTLIDGSTLRLPRMRVKGADGKDMERHPREVDVEVSRPLGEGAAGRDAQLDQAIRTLLEQLGRAEPPAPGDAPAGRGGRGGR
jgi:C-terminal processing protease CtpA/Prc